MWASPGQQMHKKRVLLIEDEPLVQLLIVDMLDELGYEVVVGAAEVKAAATTAQTEALDLAVLDIAIEDGGIFPVAAILRKRGIPFVFATGLDLSKAQDKFADTIVLQKPFGAAALDNALHKAAGGD